MKRAAPLTAALLLSASCTNNHQDTVSSEQAFVTWAQEHATPINSLEISSDNSDLHAIKQAIGDANVVVLSEGFHNCKEMMQLHHRTIRYFVEELGFNTVVTESGLPESRAIHDYVLGKPATENMWWNGLNKMYSQWAEGRALIEWMREYNQSHNNVLHYYGTDIAGFYRDWQPPFKQLTDYLDRVDPTFSQQLNAELDPVLKIMGGEKARVRHQTVLAERQRSMLGLNLDLAVNHIRSKREDYLSAHPDRKEYDWALQTAVALQLAHNYYINHLQRKDPATSKHVGLNGREIAMARNTLWAMQQRGDAKVIVINHVIHTKTASQYQGDIWGNFTPMGQLLKQELGDDMYVIGMAYGGGSFWNHWQTVTKRQVAPIQNHRPNGLENTFKSIGAPRIFIDFSRAPAAARPWLNTQSELRENDYYVQLVPSEWDGCMYLEQVSPATPATNN